jgi:hypothetical protein
MPARFPAGWRAKTVTELNGGRVRSFMIRRELRG